MKKLDFEGFRPAGSSEVEDVQGGVGAIVAGVLMVSGVIGPGQQVVDAVRGYRDGRSAGYQRNCR